MVSMVCTYLFYLCIRDLRTILYKTNYSFQIKLSNQRKRSIAFKFRTLDNKIFQSSQDISRNAVLFFNFLVNRTTFVCLRWMSVRSFVCTSGLLPEHRSKHRIMLRTPVPDSGHRFFSFTYPRLDKFCLVSCRCMLVASSILMQV